MFRRVFTGLVLGLLILAGGGYVLGTPPGSKSLFESGDRVPANAVGLVAFDMGNRVAMPRLLVDMRGFRASFVRRVEVYEGMNLLLPLPCKLQILACKTFGYLDRGTTEMGASLDDLAPALAPAGWVAWFPPRPAAPDEMASTDVVLALRVTDEKAVDAWLERGREGSIPPEMLEGIRVYAALDASRGRWAWARIGNELLLATGREPLRCAVQARFGRAPRLSGQAGYADAARRTKQSLGIVAWVDTRVLGGGSTQPLSKAVSCVQVACDLEKAETRAFVKVEAVESSAVSRALLHAPGTADLAVARCIPRRLDSYVGGDIRWQLDCVQALYRTLPERRGFDFSVETRRLLGLDLERDLLSATRGHYALSANLAEVLSDYLAALREPSRPKAIGTGLLVVDLKSVDAGRVAAEKLLTALGLVARTRSGVDGTSATWHADATGLHVAWTVMSHPSPLLVAAVGPRAEVLVEEARLCATAPGNSVADGMGLRELMGSQRGSIVYADAWNASALADVARKSAWGRAVERWRNLGADEIVREVQGVPEDFVFSALLHGWMLDLARAIPTDGPTVLAVVPDGIEITTRSARFDPVLLLAGEVPEVWSLVREFAGASPPPSISCTSNLKNFGTALEMYATDNGGLFPAGLSSLTPSYLKVIPTCPAAGSDTYSSGYTRATTGDAYTVCCKGQNHASAGYPRDHPAYSSSQGLLKGK